MRSQRWFAVLTVLMVGAVSGCGGNVFWDGASASYTLNDEDAQGEEDASSDDGAVREDGPDVLTGDSAPPVDRGPDANPPQDRVETDTLTDVLDTDVAGEDVVFVDEGDEGMVSIDVPLTGDVVDAGTAPDVSEDVAPPPDVTSPVDTTPSPDVVVMVDVGQDAGVPDVGFDATSVATDGGDAGPSDTGPTCPTGQTLCGGACISTASSVDHCGACGNVCGASPFANMTRACQTGQCGSVCSTGFANCDGLMGNGCEVDTRSSAQHCGACTRACALANATPSCLVGSCYIASCSTGFASCDGNEANGCEMDTRSSAQHCGACGRACSSTQQCIRGTCSAFVVNYARLASGVAVPGNGFPQGIYVAFSGAGYGATSCANGLIHLGGDSYQCVVAAPLTTDQIGSERVLLSIPGGCGLDAQIACPTAWPHAWSVYWYGQVYGASTQVRRRVSGIMGPAIEFIDRVTCRDFGFRQGCVGFYPPAP